MMFGSERTGVLLFGLIYIAGVAGLSFAINYFQAHPGFYPIAFLWPWIVFGCANVLLVVVPLVVVLMGYRSGYVSYEVAVGLALAFCVAAIYLAWRNR